jgi:hypothetical protein
MLHTFLSQILLVIPNWYCDEAAGSCGTSSGAGMPDLGNFLLVILRNGKSAACSDVKLQKCESSDMSGKSGAGLAAETQTRENERRCTYFYLLDLDLGEDRRGRQSIFRAEEQSGNSCAAVCE